MLDPITASELHCRCQSPCFKLVFWLKTKHVADSFTSLSSTLEWQIAQKGNHMPHATSLRHQTHLLIVVSMTFIAMAMAFNFLTSSAHKKQKGISKTMNSVCARASHNHSYIQSFGHSTLRFMFM